MSGPWEGVDSAEVGLGCGLGSAQRGNWDCPAELAIWLYPIGKGWILSHLLT